MATDNANDVDAIINEPSVTSDGTGAILGSFIGNILCKGLMMCLSLCDCCCHFYNVTVFYFNMCIV